MKFLKFSFSLLLLSLLFASCGDDELLSESIIGVWDLVSVEARDCENPEDIVSLTQVDSNNNCITVQGDTVCDYFFTFSTDGNVLLTLTENGVTDTDEGLTFTVDDDTNTGEICESKCIAFSVDDNTLTTTNIEEDFCTIILVLEKR